MAQLRRGARLALERINADLDAADEYAIDNPMAVRKLIRRVKEMLRDDIEPMLQRAAEQPDLAERIKALEEWRDECQRQNVTPFRKAQ